MLSALKDGVYPLIFFLIKFTDLIKTPVFCFHLGKFALQAMYNAHENELSKILNVKKIESADFNLRWFGFREYLWHLI